MHNFVQSVHCEEVLDEVLGQGQVIEHMAHHRNEGHQGSIEANIPNLFSQDPQLALQGGFLLLARQRQLQPPIHGPDPGGYHQHGPRSLVDLGPRDQNGLHIMNVFLSEFALVDCVGLSRHVGLIGL